MKLISPPTERIQHLATQMKWRFLATAAFCCAAATVWRTWLFRLLEGKGKAFYHIGVADDGTKMGNARLVAVRSGLHILMWSCKV